MEFDKIIYYGATPTFVVLFIFLLVILVKQIRKYRK
jgi:hypothetical protein